MKKKHIVLGIIITVLGLSSISIAAMGTPANTSSTQAQAAVSSKEWQGNGNNVNLGVLQVGDIICVKGTLVGAGLVEWIIGYSHCAVYIGNGQMVEGWSGGVRISSIDMIHNTDCAEIVRVSTSSWVKQQAVNWMLGKLGYSYDYKWLTYIGGKEREGSSYYCSELAWAGYLTYGVDIDQNPGWSWNYGYNVAPQELADDGNVYTVAYDA